MKTELCNEQPSRLSGFTRTELLVVIAVLIAIVLPVFAMTGKNRLKVQEIECVANLKQLTAHALLYMGDTGGMLPYSTSWQRTLTNYSFQNTQLLVCPSAPLPSSHTPGFQYDGTADKGYTGPVRSGYSDRSSYGLNGWLFGPDDLYGTQAGVAANRFQQFSAITNAAKTPVLMDAMWNDFWPAAQNQPANNLYTGQKGGPAVGSPSGAGGLGRCMIARHGGIDPAFAPRNVDTSKFLPGAINMSFADGHVELARLEKLWTYSWHRLWQTPYSRPP